MVGKASEGTVLYQRGDDVVTPTQAMLHGQIFDLAAIKSAALVRPVLRRSYGLWAIIIGLGITVIGFIIWRSLLTPVIAGPILLVVGLVLYFVVREQYMVVLGRQSGDAVTIPYTDQAQAQQVVGALRQALTKRL